MLILTISLAEIKGNMSKLLIIMLYNVYTIYNMWHEVSMRYDISNSYNFFNCQLVPKHKTQLLQSIEYEISVKSISLFKRDTSIRSATEKYFFTYHFF